SQTASRCNPNPHPEVPRHHTTGRVGTSACRRPDRLSNYQFLTSQFLIGKSCDGFAPLGPYLVTSDLVGDPNNLRLETRVNGEQRQDWNTNDMIFNCQQLISFASKMFTIKPGDVFFTGTPQGVIVG